MLLLFSCMCNSNWQIVCLLMKNAVPKKLKILFFSELYNCTVLYSTDVQEAEHRAQQSTEQAQWWNRKLFLLVGTNMCCKSLLPSKYQSWCISCVEANPRKSELVERFLHKWKRHNDESPLRVYVDSSLCILICCSLKGYNQWKGCRNVSMYFGHPPAHKASCLACLEWCGCSVLRLD